MLAFLSPYVWAAIAAAALGGYLKGCTDGGDDVRQEWAAATAQANDEARKMEQLRQARADEAARIAATRESRILADSASLRDAASGLRDDLRAANEYAKESRAAAERVASLTAELLGRCEARYRGVAEAAARADSEARELRDGWPK